MSSDFVMAFAALGFLGATFGSSTGTLSSEALPPAVTMSAAVSEAGGNLCRVEIARSGTPGSSEVVRQVLPDNECVCYMTTGPVGNNAGAEDLVTALLRDRECSTAPLVTAPPPQFAPVAVIGGGLLGGLVAAAGAGGLGAGLGNKSNG